MVNTRDTAAADSVVVWGTAASVVVGEAELDAGLVIDTSRVFIWEVTFKFVVCIGAVRIAIPHPSIWDAATAVGAYVRLESSIGTRR
jgi:hypothetical protein